MSEPVMLVITIEGGLVQAVTTLGVPCRVLVIDHDIEGGHGDNLLDVPTDDKGGTTEAACDLWDAVPAEAWEAPLLLELFELDYKAGAEDEDNICPGCGVPIGDDHDEDCEEG